MRKSLKSKRNPVRFDAAKSKIMELMKRQQFGEIDVYYYDEFADKINKPTYIILDNAPTHKSKQFQDKIKIWENKNLNLYFLPPYSPEFQLSNLLGLLD